MLHSQKARHLSYGTLSNTAPELASEDDDVDDDYDDVGDDDDEVDSGTAVSPVRELLFPEDGDDSGDGADRAHKGLAGVGGGEYHMCEWWVGEVRRVWKEEVVTWENLGLLAFALFFAAVFLICGLSVWTDFTWRSWYSLSVVVITFVLLIKNAFDPSLSMMFSTTLLMAARIVSPRAAISGFAEPGIFTIGILFIIAACIAETGALQLVTRYVLRKPANIYTALARMCIPIACVSGFINNAPLVAMMIPVVERWCRVTKLLPSKLMIPLSFSTILGGTLTMIGTGPNLIVASLAQNRDPSLEFPFFEIGILGGPIAITGLVYVILVTPTLLPNRQSEIIDLSDRTRQFIVTALVKRSSPIVGSSVDDALVSHLKGLTISEIYRTGIALSVNPQTVIQPGDRLTLFRRCITGQEAFQN
eukprot:TRINITY_DN7010_c0_g1_i1.p1 TRINITY_DN7010_c0_g1~~TRINITY_DN7010_c0_g1_i1.p1  ORF type:complete len:418 (+),score=45.63 TRINITY_DN7010_c0_g1_i1:87-1340(+)